MKISEVGFDLGFENERHLQHINGFAIRSNGMISDGVTGTASAERSEVGGRMMTWTNIRAVSVEG